MIQTNANWDAKNAELGKQPIYVFSISGEALVYSTHDLARAGVMVYPQYRAWLKTPRGATQSIDVLRGSSSIGEMECEIVDQGGALRQWVGSTDLEGRTAVLSVGYPGIPYSSFVPLHTYTIYKIVPSRTYTSWLFRARDRQLSAKRTIFHEPANGQLLRDSNPWIVQGTPAEIVQAIYLFALNRDLAEVDRDGMVALDSGAESQYKAVRPFWFQLTEPFEAKQFLESEVYKCSGLYPVVDNVGRLSLRSFRAPASGPVAVYTFDHNNMVVLPEIDRMPVINEIVFRLDHIGGGFQSTMMFVHGASISTYGRAAQHVIESRGLRSVLGAQWWCGEVASRLFRRFAGVSPALRGGAPVIRIEAFLMTLPVWTGDYVNVTHPLMPNILTGELGVTNRLYEVIDREPDFARGRMRYRLLDTGLTDLTPARKIAPSDRDFIIESSEVY